VPCCANVTARFAAVVVFPSFADALVTTIVRSFRTDCEKRIFVRKRRNASAPLESLSATVIRASAFPVLRCRRIARENGTGINRRPIRTCAFGTIAPAIGGMTAKCGI